MDRDAPTNQSLEDSELLQRSVAEWKKRHEAKSCRAELAQPVDPREVSLRTAQLRAELALKFIGFAVDDMRTSLQNGTTLKERELDILADRLRHVQHECQNLITAAGRLQEPEQPEEPQPDLSSVIYRAFTAAP